MNKRLFIRDKFMNPFTNALSLPILSRALLLLFLKDKIYKMAKYTHSMEIPWRNVREILSFSKENMFSSLNQPKEFPSSRRDSIRTPLLLWLRKCKHIYTRDSFFIPLNPMFGSFSTRFTWQSPITQCYLED